MIVFENKFSAIIYQRQQSPIATAALRSTLGFCRSSILQEDMGSNSLNAQIFTFIIPERVTLPAAIIISVAIVALVLVAVIISLVILPYRAPIAIL